MNDRTENRSSNRTNNCKSQNRTSNRTENRTPRMPLPLCAKIHRYFYYNRTHTKDLSEKGWTFRAFVHPLPRFCSDAGAFRRPHGQNRSYKRGKPEKASHENT